MRKEDELERRAEAACRGGANEQGHQHQEERRHQEAHPPLETLLDTADHDAHGGSHEQRQEEDVERGIGVDAAEDPRDGFGVLDTAKAPVADSQT